MVSGTGAIRKFRAVIVVAILGVTMSFAGFFVARATVHETDGQLLRQDAAQASLVLHTMIQTLTAPLDELGANLTKSGASPVSVVPAASTLASSSGSAIALLQVSAGHLRVVAHVGPLHHAFGSTSGDRQIMRLGAQSDTSFAGVFTASGYRWLQVVYSKGYVPSGYLLYGELPIAKVGVVTQLPGILFPGAGTRVFVGSVASSDLVLRTTSDPTIDGEQIAIAVVDTSSVLKTDAILTKDPDATSTAGHIIVAMNEQGPLSGKYVPLFPWAILLIGLIAAAGVTALLRAAVKRREDALGMVSQLEVQNTELDEALARQDQAEERLRQSQRMDAVGQMAGGIAHDFNNLLQAIISYSEFISDAIDPESELQRDVNEVQKAAQRAADLTRQLLVFSRQDVSSPTLLNVPAVVLDSERFLQRTIGEDILLTCQVTVDPCCIVADASELEMLLINLAINARDAMPHGGALTIAVSAVDLDADASRANELPTGRYARIDVSDTGEGMSHDVASRAFEPFFTTKETGRGTGLGLSMVYGIAKRCGGTASISSTVGAGTTVTLLIPLSSDHPSSESEASEAADRQEERRIVLLVDDQEGVRQSTTRILQTAGYDVISAQDAVAALDLYADAHIDILVTDVIMPRVSGRELADRLRADRPDLPVVFISGYSAQIISDRGNLPPSTVLVMKPFSPNEILAGLADAISDAMNPVPAS